MPCITSVRHTVHLHYNVQVRRYVVRDVTEIKRTLHVRVRLFPLLFLGGRKKNSVNSKHQMMWSVVRLRIPTCVRSDLHNNTSIYRVSDAVSRAGHNNTTCRTSVHKRHERLGFLSSFRVVFDGHRVDYIAHIYTRDEHWEKNIYNNNNDE